MNITNTNVGGWRDCEMRTYINNNIYNSLPLDLQAVIKTINKISDIGNTNTSTFVITENKLFLFSITEVGISLWAVPEQGTRYEYFTDNASRIKKYSDGTNIWWWLRSADIYNTNNFHIISDDGYGNYGSANNIHGVVFGFCI